MLALIALSSTLAYVDEPPLAIKGLDPVELAAGREVEGWDGRTERHGRFKYRFATADNLMAFKFKPEHYTVAFAGACMRMGPLSGYGSPDRWTRHEGRIYLFASESCRKTFLANPAAFLERPDDEPKGDAAAVKLGNERMASIVTGFGGADSLNSIKTWQVRTKLVQPLRDGKEFVYHRSLYASFETNAVAEWESYDAVKYGWVWSPKEGYRTTKDEWERVPDDTHEVMSREVTRHPLWLAKAWLAGKTKVVGTDTGVIVFVNGATNVLTVEPKTGRVTAIRYRGRGPNGFGTIERTMSDFKAVNRVPLPHTDVLTIDSKPAATKTTIESQVVNDKIESKWIQRP